MNHAKWTKWSKDIFDSLYLSHDPTRSDNLVPWLICWLSSWLGKSRQCNAFQKDADRRIGGWLFNAVHIVVHIGWLYMIIYIYNIIIYKHNIYARGIPWDVFGVRPGPAMRVRSCEAFFCFAQGTSMNWRTYNENQWDDSCWELASLCMLVRHDVGPKIEALAMKRCVASVSEWKWVCVCVCVCVCDSVFAVYSQHSCG